ncbi:hypothetical protein BK799_29215 [Rhodococcus sp. D-1]|nr:hypothetical protein BK799_29215 [Rhodococcus sp. D-1]
MISSASRASMWGACLTAMEAEVIVITGEGNVASNLQPDAEPVAAQYGRVLVVLTEKLAAVADYLDCARAFALAFNEFRKEIWSRPGRPIRRSA